LSSDVSYFQLCGYGALGAFAGLTAVAYANNAPFTKQQADSIKEHVPVPLHTKEGQQQGRWYAAFGKIAGTLGAIASGAYAVASHCTPQREEEGGMSLDTAISLGVLCISVIVIRAGNELYRFVEEAARAQAQQQRPQTHRCIVQSRRGASC